MATADPNLLSPTTIRKQRRSRWQKHPILAQLSHMRQWLAKRARSPGSKVSQSPGKSPDQKGASAPDLASQPPRSTLTVAMLPASKASSAEAPTAHTSTSMRRRSSLSPAPVTPHSSFRRASTGLRGRKSTSSSVSSIRSVHHRHSHSHSKASSTSSKSFTSSISKTARSPRTSVKVLPTTPTTVTFPSNIRVVRGPPSYNETAAFAPHSPGLNFARRKRRAAKGPLLNVGTGVNGPTRGDSSASRSASAAGRRSGEIIEEEDEEDIEEVDVFSPVVGPGEVEVSIDGPACCDGGGKGETRPPWPGSAVASAGMASS